MHMACELNDHARQYRTHNLSLRSCRCVQVEGGRTPPIYRALRVVAEGEHDEVPNRPST